MDKQTLTRIDEAIQSDYNYLRAIRDETGTNEASTAISFYTRFIEGIVNGLNSIYRYHHTEEFVGRFMRRKHIFSLEEKEFSRFAEDLTDEMILTGYAPAASLVREKVIPRIILLLKRWFYVLDGIEDKEFKNLRSTLFDIIAYDITALFIPGNLDRTLIHIYASQFTSPANDVSLLRMYSDHLKLPKDFGFYLAFKLQFPENWDSTLGKDDVKKLEPILESILDAKKPISNATQKNDA